MAALSSSCALLPSAEVVQARGQDGNNAPCSSGHAVECAMRPHNRRRIASVRIRLPLAVRHNRGLSVRAALVTESRLASEESTEAVDVASSFIVDDELEFPSEFDLLRLERARLSDMEDSFRADYDAEAALLEAEQDYLQQLEALLGGVSTLLTEVEKTAAPTEVDDREGIDIKVRSKRRAERIKKRQRALEKAEKVATAMAAAPPVPKPKKLQISQDPSDPVRAYLRDIGKTKLLTGAEEVALSRKIQDLLILEKVRDDLSRQVGREPTISEWSRAIGMEQNAFEARLEEGRFAKDKMVNSNLRLVVSIAKNYQNRGMTFQDLIQEGSLGLIRGAEKFDPNKGFKFSTYAHWWIRQAITRSIADQSRTIRLPIHVYEVVSRISKAKKHLYMEHGRPPHDEEVAAMVGMTVEKMKSIIKSSRAPSSMERPIGDEDSATVGELVADTSIQTPEDGMIKQLLRQDVEGVLKSLSPREREVLRLRFGFDGERCRTLEEIGTIFKVTRERIRQIEAKAMRKLRQPGRHSVLLEYLDVKGI